MCQEPDEADKTGKKKQKEEDWVKKRKIGEKTDNEGKQEDGDEDAETEEKEK